MRAYKKLSPNPFEKQRAISKGTQIHQFHGRRQVAMNNEYSKVRFDAIYFRCTEKRVSLVNCTGLRCDVFVTAEALAILLHEQKSII